MRYDILCCGLLLAGRSLAGEPEQRPPGWRISVDVQIVAISPIQGVKLIPRLHDPATFDAGFAELQGMIERDEAELIAWPVAIGDSGGKAVSASTTEVRYPKVDYPDPPPAPPNSVVPIFSYVPPLPAWGAAVPNAFETGLTGVKIEETGVASQNGEFIGLSCVSRWVRLLGDQILHDVKTLAGVDGIHQVPEFLASTTTCELTVRNGKRMLLGTFLQSKPAPRLMLYLLEAVATRVGEVPLSR